MCFVSVCVCVCMCVCVYVCVCARTYRRCVYLRRFQINMSLHEWTHRWTGVSTVVLMHARSIGFDSSKNNIVFSFSKSLDNHTVTPLPTHTHTHCRSVLAWCPRLCGHASTWAVNVMLATLADNQHPARLSTSCLARTLTHSRDKSRSVVKLV